MTRGLRSLKIGTGLHFYKLIGHLILRKEGNRSLEVGTGKPCQGQREGCLLMDTLGNSSRAREELAKEEDKDLLLGKSPSLASMSTRRNKWIIGSTYRTLRARGLSMWTCQTRRKAPAREKVPGKSEQF